MSEYESGPSRSSANMAPVLVFSGVGTGKECLIWYYPLLNDGSDCVLPPRKRLLLPPERGKGNPDEMVKVLEEKVLNAHQKIGRKVVIAAHSLGAPLAQKVVMNHPEVASDLIMGVGVNEGKKYKTPASFALRHLLGNPPTAELLNHDSDFMKEHIERVASEWPDEVKLHSVSAVFDYLLPFIHGHKLTLPTGQQAERKVIAPPIPHINFLLRLATRNQDVMALEHLIPALHANVVLHPAFINYVREAQKSPFILDKTPEIDSSFSYEPSSPLAAAA
jgi:pimeloyl-ACP methyl ester carboxylesterase